MKRQSSDSRYRRLPIGLSIAVCIVVWAMLLPINLLLGQDVTPLETTRTATPPPQSATPPRRNNATPPPAADQPSTPHVGSVEIDPLDKRLQQTTEELEAKRAVLENQVKLLQLHLEVLRQQQSRAAPLPEDVHVTVFKLRYAAPEQAAATIGQLTEGSAIRIAVDKSQNTLVVAADEKKLAMIRELLSTLDQPGEGPFPTPDNPTTTAVRHVHMPAKDLATTISQLKGNDNVEISAVEGANILILRGKQDSVRSVVEMLRSIELASVEPAIHVNEYYLQLRLVWVTNTSKWGTISPANEYLDQRVIDSLKLVGVPNASIMCQQVAFVASGTTRSQVQFTSPAMVGGNSVLFQGTADIVLDPDRVVKLNLSAEATTTIDAAPREADRSFTGRIDGSIVTPLRTYVILGTTNVVLADGENNKLSSYPAALVLYVDRLKAADGVN